MTITEPARDLGRDRGQRFGQLTYTSFDSGAGSGGWQVKDRVGLTDDEANALRARVSTQLDAGVELPRFPTPEDIAGFPRRLLYAPCADGAAWWHSVPAGNDASGRPGNVFAQALLDRAPQREQSRRPIELWRSPAWLTPYGADEVNAAHLPTTAEPVSGPVITRESVIEFLLDFSVYRLGRLGAILDACAEAMRGGRKLVLTADSIDEAALWLGGISFLMPVSWAARSLAFSTLERASGLKAVFDQGVHVVMVPRIDQDQLDQLDNIVVIDVNTDPRIGEVGGDPHQTSRGQTIPATEWSVIAQVVLIDETSAATAIDAMDRLCSGLESAGDEPGWGLAVVVSQLRELFADADAEAAQIIARSSPADLAEDSELFNAASALLDQRLEDSTERAFAMLREREQQGRMVGAVFQMLLAGYVHRALADRDWLSREFPIVLPDGRPGFGPVWLPHGARLGADAATRAVEVARSTLHELRDEDSDPDARGAIVAALADLVGRLGLQDPELERELRTVLRELFVHRLFGPQADWLVGRLGAFAEPTQARYLRPLVATDPAVPRDRPPGRRLSTATVFWLHPEGQPPAPIPPQVPDHALWLRAEFAAHCLSVDPVGYAAERPIVVWATLRHDNPAWTGTLAPYFTSAWTPRDLLELRQRFPDAIANEWLVPTLKSSRSNVELTRLCGSLLHGRSGRDHEWGDSLFRAERPTEHGYREVRDPTVDLAGLRSWADQPFFGRDRTAVNETLATAVRGAAYALRWRDVPFDPGLLHLLVPVAVLAGVYEVAPDELTRVRRALPPPPRSFDDKQYAMLRQGLGGKAQWGELGFAAMVTDERFPEPSLADDVHYWMKSCVVTTDGESLPVLKDYLAGIVNPDADHPDQLRNQTADVAWQRCHGRVENPEKSIKAIERFAAGWVKSLIALNRAARKKATP